MALALDPDRLYSMRVHIESCRDSCALFDTPRWVQNFEFGLQAAWKRREQGLATDHISVEDRKPVVVVIDSMFS